MALTVTNLSAEPRAFSIGPLKVQLLNFTAASADVAGTFVADALSSIAQVHVIGLELTAAPTISGNSVTLAFADPAAARAGTIMVMGR